jgi:hypothetical protein
MDTSSINICDQFISYLNNIRNVLGDFNAKLSRTNLLKLRIWNENLDENNNAKMVRVVNF